MKLFGFLEKRHPQPSQAPEALREVTLVATPAELRRIAQFLLDGASSMERLGASFSHEHLSDLDPEIETSPNLIISNPHDHAV
jgi:hypothetical protein